MIRAAILSNGGLEAVTRLYTTRRPPDTPIESRYGAFGLLQWLMFFEDPTTAALPSIGPMLDRMDCAFAPEEVRARVWIGEGAPNDDWRRMRDDWPLRGGGMMDA